MSFYKYVLTGLMVATLSLGYNFAIFRLLDFYPDAGLILPFLEESSVVSLYFLIFLRGFLIGMVLMYLFAHGANSLLSNSGEFKDDMKTVFFFSSYGFVSLLVFTLGDFVLMGSTNGLFLLVTFDSFIESMIALIPIRVFYFSWFKKEKKG